MTHPETSQQNSRYVLATGEEGADRLMLVEDVHGADTETFLVKAGVREGMRVADIGCGVGIVTGKIARMVGPLGEVVGVDISPDQVRLAEGRARESGVENVRFVTAAAEATGLERETFDMVYARFLLMHVPDPMAVLHEMTALLKRGGVLAVEDGDFTAPYCVPASPAFDRCFELYRQAVQRQGADPVIGAELPRLVRSLGFPTVNIRIAQPVLREGPAKRLPEWTLLEAAPVLVESGLATDAEIEAIARQMRVLAADVSAEFGMALMTQVWATKT